MNQLSIIMLLYLSSEMIFPSVVTSGSRTAIHFYKQFHECHGQGKITILIITLLFSEKNTSLIGFSHSALSKRHHQNCHLNTIIPNRKHSKGAQSKGAQLDTQQHNATAEDLTIVRL